MMFFLPTLCVLLQQQGVSAFSLSIRRTASSGRLVHPSLSSFALFDTLESSTTSTSTSVTTTPSSLSKLSDIDEMCIENVALGCLESKLDCDVEEYDALRNQLQIQKEFHTNEPIVEERIDHIVHDLKVQTDHKLSDIDEMCIENVAQGCLESSLDCDVEEYDALVNQLQDQKVWHKDREDEIEHLVHDLKAQTDHKLSDIDEMCIENVAQGCLEESLDCDLEEYDALVNQLQDQKVWHKDREDEIEHLVHILQDHQHQA